MIQSEQEQLNIAKVYIKQILQQLAYLIDPQSDFDKVYKKVKTQKFRYTNKQSVDVMYVSRMEHMEVVAGDTEVMFSYLKTIYNLLSTCSFTYLKLLSAGLQIEGTEAGKGVFRASIKQLEQGRNLELIIITTVNKQE